MAKSESDNTQPDQTQECMPCGARGTLISKLGGQESVVACPWCEGTGERRKGVDAQAHWGGQGSQPPQGEHADAAL